jgi:hypothetical protein
MQTLQPNALQFDPIWSNPYHVWIFHSFKAMTARWSEIGFGFSLKPKLLVACAKFHCRYKDNGLYFVD